MTDRKALLDAAEHVVVKIGSAVLLAGPRRVDRTTFVSLVADVNRLLDAGMKVTLVSSGAVALGRQRLGTDGADGPPELPRLQALAALGQSRLIQMYDREFGEYGRQVAQILLGRADLDQRTSFLNARLTLDAVHRLGTVPVVNENDTVATEELRFGDNDELAAATTGIVRADLLVILSDVEGVLKRRADGTLGARIPTIAADDPALDEHAGPSTSGFGRGGMVSKVAAARMAGRFGCPTIIAPGKRDGILREIAAGDDVGTLVTPGPDALQGRKVWLGAGAIAVGKLVCDAGAVRAVTRRGASLLPSGIVEVEGDFPEGSVVELVGPDGEAFARGMATYSARDTRQIAGERSDKIAEILGFKVLDAAVHRDSLLLL